VPLLPYLFDSAAADRFLTSTVLSLAVLFGVGAARARVGTGTWWMNGVEMLGLGIIVGLAAYYAGAMVNALIG
jgi:VIT1/CCC1 family predicted Fe2+/Mn2+ transporter